MAKLAPTPLAANLVKAGWGYPLLAKKAHYFQEGEAISLCGKWMFTGERFTEASDCKWHCVACGRKLNG